LTKCIFNLAIILTLSLSCNKAFGDTKSLDGYIDSKCKKGCVSSSELDSAVLKASKKFSISSNLILSVVSVESGFKKKAVNGGNVGLMQVNMHYHRSKFKGANPYSTFKNVEVGSIILKECLDRSHNSLNRALVCYNGHGDKNYVSKIRKRLAEVNRLVKHNNPNKQLTKGKKK